MTLKTPFKCYWKHQPDTIYTVSDRTDSDFLCSWLEPLGREATEVVYSKCSLLHQVEIGDVIITEGWQQEQPMVTISEEEYHSLIEEINMLQELIVELSSVNTSQEQQAETYQELQKLLRNHHSFQDADGENTTYAQELCDTVRVLQAAYNRVYD